MGVSLGRVIGPTTSYWDGSGYGSVGVEVFVSANYVGYASGTWSFATAPPPLTSGLRYLVRSKTTDYAGNVENYTSHAQTSFLYDVTKPTAAVATFNGLPPGATMSALSPILGTAYDGPGVSAGLGPISPGNGVELRIMDRVTNLYWDNSGALTFSLDGNAGWFAADSGSAGSWSATVTGLNGVLVVGRQYLVQVRARDVAVPANVGPSSDGTDSNFTLNKDSFTITFDNTPPTSSIALPLDTKFYNTLATINGGALDAVGLSTVALNIKNTSIAGPNNCYSSSSKLFDGPCGVTGWFKASGSNNPWDFTFSPQPWTQANSYVVTSSATDLAGNVQVALSSAVLTYDSGLPTAAVTAPAVAYFRTTPRLRAPRSTRPRAWRRWPWPCLGHLGLPGGLGGFVVERRRLYQRVRELPGRDGHGQLDFKPGRDHVDQRQDLPGAH